MRVHNSRCTKQGDAQKQRTQSITWWNISPLGSSLFLNIDSNVYKSMAYQPVSLKAKVVAKRHFLLITSFITSDVLSCSFGKIYFPFLRRKSCITPDVSIKAYGAFPILHSHLQFRLLSFKGKWILLIKKKMIQERVHRKSTKHSRPNVLNDDDDDKQKVWLHHVL